MRVLEDDIRRASIVAGNLPFSKWFFGEALAFDGVMEAASYLDDEALWGLLEQMLGEWPATAIRRPLADKHIDAPVRSILALAARARGRSDLVTAATDVCGAISATPRYEGALLHELHGYRNRMVFVDCIYYVGPHLAALAAYLNKESLLDEGVAQTVAHIRLLRAPSGLFHHVYDPASSSTNGIAWGRGNGWAMLGIVDTLEFLPPRHSARPQLMDALQGHADICQGLQHASGHWHTILDDPNSPLEPSIAPFFYSAIAKGLRLSLLPPDLAMVLDRAWPATEESLNSDGGYPTSMTEWPVSDAEPYCCRPSGVNPWGQGAYLRAAVEHCRR